MPGTLHPTKLAARMTQAHSEHDKDDRDKSRPAQGFQRHFREKVRPTRLKTAFSAILGLQGELFRARAHTRPRRANFFAHRAQRRGGFETNNTSARLPELTNETASTFASPQHPE